MQEENSRIRDDYTNLQIIYGAKLVLFTVVSITTILQTLNNFHSLMVGAFTFSIGILFDFLVTISMNKGPKNKLSKLSKVAFGATIVVVALVLVLLLSQYNLPEFPQKIITWITRIEMGYCGIVGPYTERALNRPNDD